VGNYAAAQDTGWQSDTAEQRFLKLGVFMQQRWLGLMMGGMLALPGLAQEPIYRCGNEYTNTKPDAQNSKACKLVEGGNVTVVQGTRVNKSVPAKAGSSSATGGSAVSRMDSSEQKARDSDARLILQSELKKALERQENLRKELNNGEPEKRADETRNNQKYLDRVSELKASIARIDSDIAGIRREIERATGAPSNVNVRQ
jgi:hypothetical protein